MYWIIIVIVFAVITAIEIRKERKNSNYRSWMDDDSVKTLHGPNQNYDDDNHRS